MNNNNETLPVIDPTPSSIDIDYVSLNDRITELARQEFEDLYVRSDAVSRINDMEKPIDVYMQHAPQEFMVSNARDASQLWEPYGLEFDIIHSPYDLSAELMPLIQNGHTVDGQSQFTGQEAENNIVATNGVLGRFTAQIQHERGEISNEVAVSHGLSANAMSGGRGGISIS